MINLNAFREKLKQYNTIDLPKEITDTVIEYLNNNKKDVDLISEKDIDYVFQNTKINWKQDIKYISFNIVYFYAIEYIKIYTNFLDKDEVEVDMGIDKDIYMEDKFISIIPNMRDINDNEGGKLIRDCFDNKLLDLFEDLGIKFVQGAKNVDGIIDLELDGRPYVYATSDT